METIAEPLTEYRSNRPGMIRPQMTLIGSDWCQPRLTNVKRDKFGMHQAWITDVMGDAWVTMVAYLSAHEARVIAARFAKLADEIDVRS
jgi:hypothetical protein